MKILKITLFLLVLGSLGFLVNTYLEVKDNPLKGFKHKQEVQFKDLVGIKKLESNFELANMSLISKTPIYRKGEEWSASFNEKDIEAFHLNYKYDNLDKAINSIRKSKLLLELIEIDTETTTIKTVVRVRETIK